MKTGFFILTSRMTISGLATAIGILLVVAALANGSVEYLKRVGWLEHGTYTKFMETYCSGLDAGPCLCMRDPPTDSATNLPDEEYIYLIQGYERLLKIFKDALFVGFILLSCYLIQTKRAPPPDSDALVLPLLLAASVGAGFLISLFSWGGMFALVGLRSFGFLAVAFVGGWVFAGIQGIAKCVAALLAIQFALVCTEVLIGVPLRDCPSSFRTIGTMALPNSLGIFAVIALAFYYSYSRDKKYFPLLVIITVLILLASGSGTGMLVLFIFLSMCFLKDFIKSRKYLFTTVLLLFSIGLLVILPALINRPDVYSSIDGRLEKLGKVLTEFSVIEILVGRGVGFGTNAAKNLISSDVMGEGFFTDFGPGVVGGNFIVDSTATVFLTQLGIIGVVLFYGMLAWAYRRDPGARPMYLVIGIASLTMNITEVFPVNFLLGLTLAGTLSLSNRAHEISRSAVSGCGLPAPAVTGGR